MWTPSLSSLTGMSPAMSKPSTFALNAWLGNSNRSVPGTTFDRSRLSVAVPQHDLGRAVRHDHLHRPERLDRQRAWVDHDLRPGVRHDPQAVQRQLAGRDDEVGRLALAVVEAARRRLDVELAEADLLAGHVRRRRPSRPGAPPRPGLSVAAWVPKPAATISPFPTTPPVWLITAKPPPSSAAPSASWPLFWPSASLTGAERRRRSSCAGRRRGWRVRAGPQRVQPARGVLADGREAPRRVADDRHGRPRRDDAIGSDVQAPHLERAAVELALGHHERAGRAAGHGRLVGADGAGGPLPGIGNVAVARPAADLRGPVEVLRDRDRLAGLVEPDARVVVVVAARAQVRLRAELAGAEELQAPAGGPVGAAQRVDRRC